jgi:PAS domain S-box-containing protein
MMITMSGEADAPSLSPSESTMRELRDERDRLEAVLDATNDAILLVDTHETLTMATPQFEAFTGISRYDILGLPIERFTAHPRTASLPPAMANVIRALAGNNTESLGAN